MKIIYYLKNLKLTNEIKNFIHKKLEKLKKFLTKKEETLVEVELFKNKETTAKSGLYKVKIILDLPKKSLIVAKGIGKNMIQAISDGFNKLFRQIRKK